MTEMSALAQAMQKAGFNPGPSRPVEQSAPGTASMPDDVMSEEEQAAFEADIDDPDRIAAPERAAEIMAVLDHEIASIEAQIGVAKVRYAVVEMPPETMAWLRRASYALAAKRRERHRVAMRHNYLIRAGEAMRREVAKAAARAEAQARTAAMQAKAREAEAQKAARLAEAQKAEVLAARARAAKQGTIERAKTQRTLIHEGRRRSRDTLFVLAAIKALPVEQRKAIWDRAREIFPDDPCWLDASEDEGVRLEIRRLYVAGEADCGALARRFDLPEPTVVAVVEDLRDPSGLDR